MTRPTPMLDAAIREAKKAALDWQPLFGQAHQFGGATRNVVIAALRAAHPWTPPPEVIEAMAREIDPQPWTFTEGSGWLREDLIARQNRAREKALAAYRAHPLMSELWKEEER